MNIHMRLVHYGSYHHALRAPRAQYPRGPELDIEAYNYIVDESVDE